MFGKVIGAVAGAQAAKHSAAIGGTGGAFLGALAVPLVRRLSIPALLVVGAGGYLVKRAYDKRNGATTPKTARRSKAAEAASKA